MKHEITNRQSTQSVLKMLFECKTFDQKNQERGNRSFEAEVNLENGKFEFVDFYKKTEALVSV